MNFQGFVCLQIGKELAIILIENVGTSEIHRPVFSLCTPS